MNILCAIPCLNEEVAIATVVLKARRHVDQVIVVDDGSLDRTTEVAEMAGATVLRHPENMGKGAAYRTLWQHAREQDVDALVVLDGDGQHDAEEIPLLLAKLREGADVVIGARWGDTTEMPRWRRAGKRVLDYTTALASGSGAGSGKGPRVTDSQSGFRAYSRRALEEIQPHHHGFSVESQLLVEAHQADLTIGETRIHCRYDVDGSSAGPVRHASGVLNEMITQIGMRHPLLVFAVPGLILALLGLGMTGYAGYWFSTTGRLALGTLVGGFSLLILGVLGIFAALVFNLLPRSVAQAVSRVIR
ncbi:MAG: glycosyltransferase family 2 protein [Thermoplasmatota archaeon]